MPHLALRKKQTGNENNDVDIDWSMSVFESNIFVVYSFNCMSMDLNSFGLEIKPPQVSKIFCVFQVLVSQLKFMFISRPKRVNGWNTQLYLTNRFHVMSVQ